MQDEQIIRLYFERSEEAIRQTALKYGAYLYTIAKRILHSEEESEEAVNDTWLRAWDTIPPKRPNVLRLYLAKITRNLSFSKFRAQNAEKRGGGELTVALDELGECVGANQDVNANLDMEELTGAIQRLLATLSARDRSIFIRRYFFVQSTAAIAEHYGLKESNVLMILTRARKKLKEYLIREGYSL